MLVLKVAAPPGGSLVSLAPSKPELWLSCNCTTITTYFARCREEFFKRDMDDMVPTTCPPPSLNLLRFALCN